MAKRRVKRRHQKPDVPREPVVVLLCAAVHREVLKDAMMDQSSMSKVVSDWLHLCYEIPKRGEIMKRKRGGV